MNRYILPLLLLSISFLSSCIKDEALNHEADIISLSFPENSLRDNPQYYTDYIIVYPKEDVNLRELPVEVEVTQGASYIRKENPTLDSDSLFFIKVTSESKEYSKTYPIIQSFLSVAFDFETWIKPNKNYQYENPIEGSLRWYSSNNGTAIAWRSPSKKAEDYPVRKYTRADGKGSAVELRTIVGPGKIAGGIQNIPCLAGSVYLGGFNALTGLTNPLRSTSFGVPFNEGKPTKLTGYFKYNVGSEDYINKDGTRDKDKSDQCSIYSVIFKTDSKNEFLYGDNIATSPNIIARAEVNTDNITSMDNLTYFEVDFDYNSYSTPFDWNELKNNQYKMSIVFSSSYRGQHYEGRPGSTLIVDDIKLIYDID
ncbi:hypothetical protein M2138_001444 [Dysgonomonadaceae bacterium PH5-43]|nr:hypothetical protein [Dysgonomonadaceae bacterium PH5-43]